MSEDDDGSKAPIKKYPKLVASLIVLMVFSFVYGVAVLFDYAPNVFSVLLQPVVGITIGLVFVIVVVVGLFLWFRRSGFGSVERADQLTKLEADRVATRWHRNRGFLALSTPLDGVDYVQSGGSDSDDYARIYEKVIDPKTDVNRKCILINLEQSVSVDVGDSGSIDSAIANLNDAVFFSEDAVSDFHGAREDYKEKLAGSSPGETEIVEHPDGRVTRRNVSERTIQEASEDRGDDVVEQES